MINHNEFNDFFMDKEICISEMRNIKQKSLYEFF